MPAINIVDNQSDFSELKDDWDRLSKTDKHASLFSSFAWIDSWLHHYWSEEYKLHVVLIKENLSLVAILPFYFNPAQNTLMFLGSGEPEDREVSSEYLDILLDDSVVATETLYSFIADYMGSLSQCTFAFSNCISSSHIFRITLLLKRNLIRATGKRFSIELPKSIDSIYDNFSVNQRKKARLIVNRFNKNEGLHFHSVTSKGYNYLWQSLNNLHTHDWNSRGKPGAFSHPVFSQFHEFLHNKYPDTPQLFCYLTLDGKIIAINHYYRFKNTLYFYCAGTSKASIPNLSPGLLLHMLCLSDLSDQTLVYDLMKGSLTGSYKEKFCDHSGYFYSITIYGDGIKNWFRYLARKAKLMINSSSASQS